MSKRNGFIAVCAVFIGGLSSTALAWGFNGDDEGCLDSSDPVYSNVEFAVLDPTKGPQIIKAVLTQPVEWVRKRGRRGCFRLVENPPSVVILHGSAGLDTRNAFYGQSLQRRFATLSVEMFTGSLSDLTGRPQLPLVNYPYAYGALRYLIEEAGVDPDAVGCLGLSWGGVICNQLAVEKYSVLSSQLDAVITESPTDYRFAAHVANYPVCYARNTPPIPIPGMPEDAGLDFGGVFGAELTGAPVLIQVGSEDAYDNFEGESGSAPCNDLKDSLLPEEKRLLDVVVYEGGYHAFDRLFSVADVAKDIFARRGTAIFPVPETNPELWPEVAVIPDQVIANESRQNILRFFRRNLRSW